MLLKNKIYLTFDIDWAPDHMVNQLIDICLENRVKATFFATHTSVTLQRLRKYPDSFEIGLHPNFMPGSTQGNSEEEIFDYCKKLVPDTVSIRTHCVYQHGKLYPKFNKFFGDRIVESSVCMPGVKDIKPFELFTSDGCLLRVPFFWADDYYLLGKQKIDPIDLLDSNGAKVYMFHPIHIYQNTRSLQDYEASKLSPSLSLSNVNSESKHGIGTLFKAMLKEISQQYETGLMKEWQDLQVVEN